MSTDEQPQLALISAKAAAVRLGFDTTSQNWRIGFWRFIRRHRIPVVRLSPRRLRFSPGALDAYVASHTVGAVKRFGSAA